MAGYRAEAGDVSGLSSAITLMVVFTFQLEAIARSLAVAVILDQKHQWQANKLDRFRQVFEVEDCRKLCKQRV